MSGERCVYLLFISDESESKRHSVLSDSLQPHGLCSPCNSPGQNIGMDRLPCLQGIFPTQGSNPGLPHCRWILYQLSCKGLFQIWSPQQKFNAIWILLLRLLVSWFFFLPKILYLYPKFHPVLNLRACMPFAFYWN